MEMREEEEDCDMGGCFGDDYGDDYGASLEEDKRAFSVD
jgi:hypothetical protein